MPRGFCTISFHLSRDKEEEGVKIWSQKSSAIFFRLITFNWKGGEERKGGGNGEREKIYEPVCVTIGRAWVFAERFFNKFGIEVLEGSDHRVKFNLVQFTPHRHATMMHGTIFSRSRLYKIYEMEWKFQSKHGWPRWFHSLYSWSLKSILIKINVSNSRE